MFIIYPEQLSENLRQTLYSCYIFFGNDIFLLQESFDHVYDFVKSLKYEECVKIVLDNNCELEQILNIHLNNNLFFEKKILFVTITEKWINLFLEKILYFTNLLSHKHILLILSFNKITHIVKNNFLFKILSRKSIFINCNTPEHIKLSRWISSRAKKMNLILDAMTNNLIFYYYEGNLLGITQTLEQLELLYPDRNLSFNRVQKLIYNFSYINQYHWINSILENNVQRAVFILKQLELEEIEPSILLRSVQREILLLIYAKNEKSLNLIEEFFNKKKIFYNRKKLLLKALNRLSISKLYKSIKLMILIELKIKQDHNISFVWFYLNKLTLLLCNKSISKVV